jgi:hypothetical protein
MHVPPLPIAGEIALQGMKTEMTVEKTPLLDGSRRSGKLNVLGGSLAQHGKPSDPDPKRGRGLFGPPPHLGKQTVKTIGQSEAGSEIVDFLHSPVSQRNLKGLA